MLKYEHDCYYNGGGDPRPLKKWSEFSPAQYTIVVLYHLQESHPVQLSSDTDYAY